jgi:hypothetical protein
MQCNKLATLIIEPGTFQLLVTLDISYNCLRPDALIHLAALPKLRELDLSYNCIIKAPTHPLPETSFPELETLHLGGQTPKMAPSVVYGLAGL